MKQLKETASKIKSMEIRGAGKIARAAAAELRDYAQRVESDDIGEFNKKMKHAKVIRVLPKRKNERENQTFSDVLMCS